MTFHNSKCTHERKSRIKGRAAFDIHNRATRNGLLLQHRAVLWWKDGPPASHIRVPPKTPDGPCPVVPVVSGHPLPRGTAGFCVCARAELLAGVTLRHIAYTVPSTLVRYCVLRLCRATQETVAMVCIDAVKQPTRLRSTESEGCACGGQMYRFICGIAAGIRSDHLT